MIKINYWKFGAWFVVLVPVTCVLWWFAFEPAYYSQLAMPMRVHLDRPAGATPIKVVWLMSDFWKTRHGTVPLPTRKLPRSGLPKARFGLPKALTAIPSTFA